MSTEVAVPHYSPSRAAERMRLHRKRERNGLRCVRILLHVSEIDALIRKGYLEDTRRHNPDAIEMAMGAFICDTLGHADGTPTGLA